MNKLPPKLWPFTGLPFVLSCSLLLLVALVPTASAQKQPAVSSRSAEALGIAEQQSESWVSPAPGWPERKGTGSSARSRVLPAGQRVRILSAITSESVLCLRRRSRQHHTGAYGLRPIRRPTRLDRSAAGLAGAGGCSASARPIHSPASEIFHSAGPTPTASACRRRRCCSAGDGAGAEPRRRAPNVRSAAIGLTSAQAQLLLDVTGGLL